MALQAPNRREILRIVSRGERSAGEIHRALGGLTFGAVSQHLGVLGRAGLVDEHTPGALARADLLFRPERTPYCGTHF